MVCYKEKGWLDMKRLVIKKIFSNCLSAMLIFNGISTGVSAFSSETHQYTTLRGLNILDKVQEEKYSKFYTQKGRDQIFTYCTRPDEDEIEGAYKYHFYNPATEKNFMGEDDSALTRCKNHYNQAVYYYKSGNREAAFEELGRSLHFLEDLNTPVHTNNQDLLDTAFNFTFHVNFEDKCKDIQERVISWLLKREFRYYEINSVENIAKSCAYLANDNFYALYEKLLPREIVAENSVKNAQKAVAGMLYKFYIDVN